jgi:hypothetical protein
MHGSELWAKPYGIKLRYYWECLEALGKAFGNPWEHDDNNRKKT